MSNTNSQSQKLLNFTIGEKHYLLSLDIIAEVLRYQPVTAVPTLPDVVYGVFNLRGSYIPVIDLKKRLHANEAASINKKSCILITHCQSEQQNVAVGLLIDEINEVMDVDLSQLSPAPNFGHSLSLDLVSGMFRQQQKDYIVLNVDKLVDLDALLSLLESIEVDAQA